MRVVTFRYDSFETKVIETCEQCNKKILLIHGIDCTKEIFFMYPTMFPEINFIMYDQRGFGSGKALDNDYRFERFVDDALAIYDKYKPDYVIGHSFGGVMAQELAINRGVKVLAMQTTVHTPPFANKSPREIKTMFDNAKIRALNMFFLNPVNVLNPMNAPYVFTMIMNISNVLYNPFMPAMQHTNEFLNFGDLCRYVRNKKIGVIGGKYDEIVPLQEIYYLSGCVRVSPDILPVPHVGVIFPEYVYYTVKKLYTL